MRQVGRFGMGMALVGFAMMAVFAVARVSPIPASTSSQASSETSSATPVAPCSLVTKAEAEAALGGAVSVVENPGQCTYVTADLSGRSVAVATPTGLPGPEYLEPAMQQLGTAVQGEVRTVTGVGDEAFVVLARDMSELMGVKGTSYVAIVLTQSKATADAQAATLTDLGRTAFSRL